MGGLLKHFSTIVRPKCRMCKPSFGLFMHQKRAKYCVSWRSGVTLYTKIYQNTRDYGNVVYVGSCRISIINRRFTTKLLRLAFLSTLLGLLEAPPDKLNPFTYIRYIIYYILYTMYDVLCTLSLSLYIYNVILGNHTELAHVSTCWSTHRIGASFLAQSLLKDMGFQAMVDVVP